MCYVIDNYERCHAMKSKLPALSHLEFVVLSMPWVESQKSGVIRRELKSLGVGHAHPAFYALMGRLGRKKMVRSKMESRTKGRVFTRTPHGYRSMLQARAFYASRNESV